MLEIPLLVMFLSIRKEPQQTTTTNPTQTDNPIARTVVRQQEIPFRVSKNIPNAETL